jgi:hypothetical protein
MVTKNGISLSSGTQPTTTQSYNLFTQNPEKRAPETDSYCIEVYDEIHPYIEAVIKVLAFFDGARLRLGLACLLHYESSKYSI